MWKNAFTILCEGSTSDRMIPHKNCTGCAACAAICPRKCIKMEENMEGFYYPVIDSASCVKCNLCKKVCPLDDMKRNTTIPRAYAIQARDSKIIEQSSSGGVFTLIAKQILKNGGCVIGASFDEEYEVKHTCIDDLSQLHTLMGSKYVQSEIAPEIYKRIKQSLIAGQKCLFVGTPCQTEGVRRYLGSASDSENLLLVDILCHGVPSRKVWRKYLQYRKGTDGASPKEIYFRNKDISWKTFSLKFIYDDREDYCKSNTEDLFYKGFLRNIFLRPSCYSCAFKSLERNADLTIGDFWEIKDFSDQFDMSGVSLVFSHTEKGEKLISSIIDDAKIEKFDDAKQIPNGGLYHSAFYNLDRSAFFRNLDKIEFPELYNKYFGARMSTRIKRVIARLICK